MTAEIIKGLEVAKIIRKEIRSELEIIKEKTGGKLPVLSIVMVGDNRVSLNNVKEQEKEAQTLGIQARVHKLPEDTQEEEVIDLISKLNRDPEVHGIIIHFPLPYHVDDWNILKTLSSTKDVEGLHPENIGRLVTGRDSFLPCTPQGCLKLLEYINYQVEGKHAVVVGRSNVVGKPMANLLLQRNATVTICHSYTKDLPKICRQADLLVVAVGRPRLIKGDWVKKGAVVIDVGINCLGDKIVGDVDFEEVSKVASYITPVPGGVEPVTIPMLMINVINSFKRISGIK